MNSDPPRGLYDLSIRATQAIEDVRAHVARFIGASDANEVVFTRNATESLNLAAKTLGPALLEPG